METWKPKESSMLASKTRYLEDVNVTLKDGLIHYAILASPESEKLFRLLCGTLYRFTRDRTRGFDCDVFVTCIRCLGFDEYCSQ